MGLLLAAGLTAHAHCQVIEKSVEKSADGAATQRVEISAQPVTLSDTEQRRRDPVAKTVVGRDELDKYGDLTVSDVLKRLPGVNMQGGNPKLRGLGAGYTLVLINGDAAPPGFSLDNLSPSQVERIEITRGPSAEHSAQAVAGTLNIILREAPRQRQRELRATLGYQAQRPVLSVNGSWGDRDGRLSYSLPLAVHQWRGRADSMSDAQGLGLDQQPQRWLASGADVYWGTGFNFSPRLTFKLSDTDSLNWQSFAQDHRYKSQSHTATEVLQGASPLSVDDETANNGLWQMQRSSLQWQQRWADGSKLDMTVGGQATDSRYHTLTQGRNLAGVQTLTRDTNGHNTEHGLSTKGKLTRPLGEAHTLAAGWDAEQRSRTSSSTIIENGASQLPGYDDQPLTATVRRAALFVQDEWEMAPRWSSYLGLRAERINITSAGVDSELSNASQVITPIWHLNHKLNAAGRDLLRASLTRSYKAPELSALVARPSINSSYPLPGANTELTPDRWGNPVLRPELATGLDLALEKYLPQGGVLSVSGFYRSITGLIRNQVTLQSVPGANVQRWVSQPVNLARARSTGVELELKGRADELLPAGVVDWVDWAEWAEWAAPGSAKGLSLRSSVSIYRSAVTGLPGPDNRLEQQQPWSATAGFDQVMTGVPLTVGASLAWTPAYRVQQTERQSLTQGRIRTLDFYALWALNKLTSLRLAGNNLLADNSVSLTELPPDAGSKQSTLNTRSQRRSVSASLLVKF